MTLIKIYFVNTIKALGQEVSKRLAEKARTPQLIRLALTAGTGRDCCGSVIVHQIRYFVRQSPTTPDGVGIPSQSKPYGTVLIVVRVSFCMGQRPTDLDGKSSQR